MTLVLSMSFLDSTWTRILIIVAIIPVQIIMPSRVLENGFVDSFIVEL